MCSLLEVLAALLDLYEYSLSSYGRKDRSLLISSRLDTPRVRQNDLGDEGSLRALRGAPSVDPMGGAGDAASGADAGSAAASGEKAVTQPIGSRLQPNAASQLMPPPAPRQQRVRKQVVLDEDEYTARLEKIITRDYFPDVPKLKNKLEWLEATRSGDPELIRQAQVNIHRRQLEALGTPGGVIGTPSLGGSSGTFGIDGASTPSVHRNAPRGESGRGKRSEPSTPSSVAGSEFYNDGEYDDDALVAAVTAAADARLGLDGFLNKYTSEDNASFNRILERQNASKRARHSWLQQKTHDDKAATDAALLTAATRTQALTQGHGAGKEALALITDSSGTSDGVGAPLAFTKFKAKNELYYNVDGVALSTKELEQRVQGPPKETVARNTRFVKLDESGGAQVATARVGAGGAGSSGRNRDDPAATVAREMNAAGHVRGGAAHQGYSMVMTPSPAPGIDDSPFMTWGDIQGTPLRLDMEETPVDIGGWGGGGASGGRFHIKAPKGRDDVLRKMTQGSGHAITPTRSSVQTGAGSGRPRTNRLGTPGGSGASPRLSDAARSLLRRMHGTPGVMASSPSRSGAVGGGGGGLDQALRVTYSGRSPARTPSRVGTPNRGMPSWRTPVRPGGGGAPGAGARRGTTPLETASRLGGAGHVTQQVPPLPPTLSDTRCSSGDGKNITDDLLNL